MEELLQPTHVELEIDSNPALTVDTNINSDEDDHLPDYESLEAGVSLEEPPPLDYDTVVGTGSLPATESTLSKGTLIAEAPPSYRELFGIKESTEPEAPKSEGQNNNNRRLRRIQRPHTQSRRPRSPPYDRTSETSSSENDSPFGRLMSCFSSITTRMFIICIALTLLTLPISMLVIGSINFTSCTIKIIPLYLVIAGLFLSLEIAFHTFTFIASLKTDDEATLRSLRMCDCFALFIFLWVVIGSNWIFKVSLNYNPCPTGNDGSGGLGDLTTGFTTPPECEVCSRSIYQFALGVIVIQYLVVFLLLVACCSAAIKRGTD